MVAAESTSLAGVTSSTSGLRSLLAMIGTRGLDQVALGAASLLIARRTGTVDFAPFATVFILYSLASQVGDGGLAFGVLRTPATLRISSAERAKRIKLGLVVAFSLVVLGIVVGGTSGTVMAIAGMVTVTGPAVFVGRAALQWSGQTQRLSVGEAVGAVVFITLTIAFVQTADDLLLFGMICVVKHLIELTIQGLGHEVFSATGGPVRTSGIFVSQVVNYLAANVDYVIVGMVLGAEALSIYAIGFRLASAFSSVVSAPLTRTAFVDFANAADRQRQLDRLVRRVAAFGGIGVLATVVAALALPVLLGPDWLETRRVTWLLGIALPWRLLLGPVIALGLIHASARRVIAWETIRAVALAAAIVAGSSSIETVAGAVAAATIITVGWTYRRAVTGAQLSVSRTLEVSGFVLAGLAILLVAT